MIYVSDCKNNVWMSCLASHESVEEVVQRPLFWHFTAERLTAVADILWEHIILRNGTPPNEYEPSVLKPAVLLLAFAFENVLKGLAAAKGKVEVVGGNLKWPKSAGGGHNLSAFAKLAGETPSDDEILWLDCLNEAIYWWGRYPSSKNQSDSSESADRCLDWEPARAYLSRLITKLGNPCYMVMGPSPKRPIEERKNDQARDK